MSGFQIRRQGFKTAGAVMLSIVDDMLANGFTYVGPGSTFTRPTGSAAEDFAVTLEAGPDVDPLSDVQKWRMNITVFDNATAGIIVGSMEALPNDGSLPYVLRMGKDGKNYFDSPRGVVGKPYTKIASVVNPPAENFDTCITWAIGDDISSTQLPKDHPNFGKTSTVSGSERPTIYKFDKTMFGSETYVKYCTEKVVGFTYADISDKSIISPEYLDTTQGFINRAHRVWQGVDGAFDPTKIGPKSAKPSQPSDPELDLSASFPLSYYLAITPRGIFLSIWEGAASDVDGDHYSWVLVQRPVDRDTGQTVVTGKSPVFCVSSVGNVVNRFVVRESDVIRATDIVLATEDTTDTSAIINDKIQVAVSEDNQYVVSFPSRLNTPRYAYTHELDMIGYTSATVVSQNTEIPLTLYGEATPRKYVAVHSNMANSNGMRIVALQNGGGITAA